MAKYPYQKYHEGISLKPTRRLGELNECVLLFRFFTFPLLFLGLLLWFGRDTMVNRLAFIGAKEATGTITDSFETNFIMNEEAVTASDFTYTFEGKSYQGYSFSYDFHQGTVPVAVSRYNPGLAKIKGSSYSQMMGLGFWLIQLPVFLLVWFILARIRTFWRTRRLLTRGMTVRARTKERPTGQSSAKEHIFFWQDQEGQEHKTNRIMVGITESAVLIYLPGKPDKVRFFMDLKYPDALTEEGDWERPSAKAFLRKTFWFWVGLSIAFWGVARIGKIMFP
ncbi:MAG: hypothetical protein QNK37_24470 [Acidobacteriota bacterium]|nr:hypothetical protein [Acidobacteriota bacterium]